MNIDDIPLLSEADRQALADRLARELLNPRLRREIERMPRPVTNNYGLSESAQICLDRARQAATDVPLGQGVLLSTNGGR